MVLLLMDKILHTKSEYTTIPIPRAIAAHNNDGQ